MGEDFDCGFIMDLTGKTALVTGASRGIGAAIFAAFGAAGARVIGTATSAAGTAVIEKAGAAFAAGGEVAQYDSGDEASNAALLAQVDAGGGADIVVVNAAISADSLLMRMNADKWNRVIDANLSAMFRLTQPLIVKMMKKRYGRVIFLSSIVASIGNPGQANYCAAKAGMEGYCRAVAKEVAGRGITANAIAPGFIQTDMTANLPEATKDYFIKNIPMGRAGLPAEVAQLALFLASDAAAYITGQVIHINGGMHTH